MRARDLDHREVIGWERADERGRVPLAVRGRDHERRRSADDVVVRHDVSGRIEDDSGAEPLLILDLHDCGRYRMHDIDDRALQRDTCRRGQANRGA